MTPWLDDGDVKLYHGDVLDVLRQLQPGSVQTCVTSPPYWGLRDYGTATWEGGDADCDHKGQPYASRSSTLTTNGGKGPKDGDKLRENGVPYRKTCGKCGATRKDAQMGLEPTPGEYVARMVQVFREVRRVLRDDGTLWLNLGDSYAGSACGLTDGAGDGLKPKDLVGIPWRVAFALQEDGWYLRSDIIWAKPNPMPESVTDRPTKSHEYLFLLTKSPRYFYDAEAIREAMTTDADKYLRAGASVRANGKYRDVNGYVPSSFARVPEGRNARSVWTITTKPYAGAHFATFPVELPQRCIKAGSAPGDVVLDPFSGSGTTAWVARHHGRRAVGIELNEDYLALSADRLRQLSLLGDAVAGQD